MKICVLARWAWLLIFTGAVGVKVHAANPAFPQLSGGLQRGRELLAASRFPGPLFRICQGCIRQGLLFDSKAASISGNLHVSFNTK